MEYKYNRDFFFSHKEQSHVLCGEMGTTRDFHIKYTKSVSEIHTFFIFVPRFNVGSKDHVCMYDKNRSENV